MTNQQNLKELFDDLKKIKKRKEEIYEHFEILTDDIDTIIHKCTADIDFARDELPIVQSRMKKNLEHILNYIFTV